MFTGGIEDPTDDEEAFVRTDGWSWEPEGEDREGMAVRRFHTRKWMEATWRQMSRDYAAEQKRQCK